MTNNNWYIGLSAACMFLLFLPSPYCQKVNISRDINVRNDLSYDILHAEENVLFFRDKGSEFYFDIFDENMEFKRSVEILFDERRPAIENIHAIDSFIQMVYAYREGPDYVSRMVRYDKKVNLIDSMELIRGPFLFSPGEMRSVLSDDMSKLALFTIDKARLFAVVVDTRKMEILTAGDIEVPEYRLYDQFQEAGVSNQGQLFFLFEKNNESWDKEKHMMRLVMSESGQTYLHDLTCINTVNSGVKMGIDNVNQRLTIAGLYGSKSQNETEGYMVFSATITSLRQPSLHDIQTFPYDENILVDLNGVEKKSKKNQLYDFYIKTLVQRADGGFIMIAELQREYARRNVGLSNFDRSMAASRGYVDYYSEDLILFSIQPDGSLFWRKILFKKQFSQDDEGIYSSFFIMKVPSQMHFIFNDEIKNNNTVSEYVIDPLGNYRRNSLLSTEYKNLKLRFQDAVQTSSQSFVVPSEKNGRINLVKITF
ncbi:MAG: hypothetical protein IPH94_00750 [Saprospiraceae bacterium]|nr:hypothetical protein [Saprospiraceae bacterium]MBK7787123.1 hypothetical protein [Saprospiraceae bacterium]MBL0082072.1 hypothetical protein [Saprospiraceae bacterium]